MSQNKILYNFFIFNRIICARFDKYLQVLSSDVPKDGRKWAKQLVKAEVSKGMVVYDVGSGKRPFFKPSEIQELSLTVIGLDISQDELSKAPTDSYTQTVVADIQQMPNLPKSDFIVCLAVLEHVKNAKLGLIGINNLLKSNGKAVIFFPNRNSGFALLNRIIPHSIKLKILAATYPELKQISGFPAYYDRCTDKEFKRLCYEMGLTVRTSKYFTDHGYFRFFAPLHICWRMFSLIACWFSKTTFCESMAYVVERVDRPLIKNSEKN